MDHAVQHGGCMRKRTVLGDWIQLVKPRIIQLNLVAAFGGYWLASKWVIDWGLLCWMLLGTTLTMASSCIFNNIWDHKLDRKMVRTNGRPLATGRIQLTHALWCALVLGILGEWILFLNVNRIAGWLGLLGMFFYIVIYTMWLKRKSTWSTAVGGVSGAVPPVIGYCASTGTIDTGAVLLFCLLFLWQPAHFWSLAIRRVEEYRAAGFPLLPVRKGVRRTKLQMIPYVTLLLPTVILLYVTGFSGPVFLIVSVIGGVIWLWHTLRGMIVSLDERWARTNFLISVNYLMIVFIVMILDTPAI